MLTNSDSFVKMGTYLNPSSKGFAESLHSEIYIDKSGLISYTNRVLNTKQKFVCVSRPRRFGKTMAAEMLVAYYGRDCDSRKMFANLRIANDGSFSDHLNKYNVIFLNMQKFLSESNDISGMICNIKDMLLEDIKDKHPELYEKVNLKTITFIFNSLYKQTQVPFVFIIDEWDCVFRRYKTDTSAQKKYLDFLSTLLKDEDYVALAYMTGILPIKKHGGHSELNMFYEFAMTDPRSLAEFIGFTQDEVVSLCDIYKFDHDEISRWYDGYRFPDIESIYNPKSVVEALLSGRCNNYWTRTETYEALSIYFNMNFDGLKNIIIQLLAGEKKKADIRNFSNDMVTFKTCDDILTLLIHLGYLRYDFETREVSIPNKEISDEFVVAIKDVGWSEVINAVNASDDLLKATWRRDSKTVAKMIERTHNETSHLQYNDENALSYVVSLAYFCARDFYEIIREMPTGTGFADLVFVPYKSHADKPAILIELKWNKSANTAIKQIKNRNYPEVLQDYKGNILLIGINYDKKSKKHECIIEKA